ncbi:hypothetical protein DFJ77DRAFT_516671 [Powellomyces hirtus]|nr:hypothetical protein DFJ77DRAFT_516671 [Powellomyces hirtus]
MLSEMYSYNLQIINDMMTAGTDRVPTKLPPLPPHGEPIVAVKETIHASGLSPHRTPSLSANLVPKAKRLTSSSSSSIRSVNVAVASSTLPLPHVPPEPRLSDEDAEESAFLLLNEFMANIASKHYESALSISAKILAIEPSNTLMREFQPVLQERIAQIAARELESEGSSEDDEESEEEDVDDDDDDDDDDESVGEDSKSQDDMDESATSDEDDADATDSGKNAETRVTKESG